MWRIAAHPSIAPLSRKVNGREAQIEGIYMAPKSRELNRVNTCNDKA